MLIAICKLADIAARSFFVLIVLYSLPARLTGQFGLALTLVGFFSFFSGYERYLDLQRVLVGKTFSESDQLIRSVLRFFRFNYLIWLPILAILLYLWAQIPLSIVGLWLMIAIGEHIASEAYRLVLITNRHRALLLVGLAKNLALLLLVIFSIVCWQLYLEFLLMCWAILSLAGLMISALIFRRGVQSSQLSTTAEVTPGLIEQYSRSKTHFLIGLVAVASLQLDRLIAGGLMPLETSGVYFRHIFLALAAYQVLGVLSHNRILAQIYRGVAAGKGEETMSVIRREQWHYVPLTFAFMVITIFIGPIVVRNVAPFNTIVPNYLAALMLVYLIRGLADYNSLVLNAVYAERQIFKSQMTMILTSTVCSVVLIPVLGLPGIITGMLVGTVIYFFITGLFTRRAINLMKTKEQL